MILSNSKFFLLISITSLFLPTPLHANLLDMLAQCTSIEQDSPRLKCYDSISLQQNAKQKAHYLKPPKDFLSSELRTTLRDSEYSLSVADFVALIEQAKLENGDPVVLTGWVKQKNSFILKIKMRKNISLVFTHIKTKEENICLLLPVIIDGDSIDASVFITTIAAMTPD